MCGISAVLSLGGLPTSSSKEYSSPLNDQIDASLDLIQHRGPDSRGTWTSNDGKVRKFLIDFLRSRTDVNPVYPSL